MKKIGVLAAIIVVAALAVFLLAGCGAKDANDQQIGIEEEEVAKASTPAEKIQNAVQSTVKKTTSTAKQANTAKPQTNNSNQASNNTSSDPVVKSSTELGNTVQNTVDQAIGTLKPAMTNPEKAWEDYGNNTANQWKNYVETQGDYWSSMFK